MILLHRKALTTATGPARIGIAKVESLSVQAIREVEHSIDEVKKTLQVCYQLHSIILKNLVHRPWLIIEVQLVTKARTSPTHYAHAQEIRRIIRHACIRHKLMHLRLRLVADVYAIVLCYHFLLTVYS